MTYVVEAAGEEGEGEVGALVDELQPDAALAPVDVVCRVVGELILRAPICSNTCTIFSGERNKDRLQIKFRHWMISLQFKVQAQRLLEPDTVANYY